jgi:hypothetical protein
MTDDAARAVALADAVDAQRDRILDVTRGGEQHPGAILLFYAGGHIGRQADGTEGLVHQVDGDDLVAGPGELADGILIAFMEAKTPCSGLLSGTGVDRKGPRLRVTGRR